MRVFTYCRLLPLFIFAYLNVFVCHAQLYTIVQQGNISANFIRKSAFQQEVARFDISVERAGETALPISLVPRVRKDDIIHLRMLEEAVNGIKPDESYWDWTLVVAYVNKARNENIEDSVSPEINFRRDGWYREYLFTVPFDSQPVFFLYPKQKYRKKIRKLINKNYAEISKIGEKTLEIAGAYAQIGTFLNQLQQVINQSPFAYNQFGGYGVYGGYSPYGSQMSMQFMQNQAVERLAQSFNIALPTCWQNGSSSSYYGSNSNDFVTRAQCVAKNVRLEDFDFSVGRLLQQGGLVAATRLVQKYPQLAYWINVAALAADLIIKVMQKTPLRVVPTLVQAKDDQSIYGGYSSYGDQNQSNLPLQQKISIYAEKPPTNNDYVTAFPIVVHNWQPEADPDVIGLPVPKLLEPCLHNGMNILKNTDLSYDWLRDEFARDFKLIMSADNGFTKEFRLQKNQGLQGWAFTINPQDLQAMPKVRMTLIGKIIAMRGFNRLESEEFPVPLAGGGDWEIDPEAQKEFSIGGKRKLVVRNTQGSCRCLQAVTYKPSFGGEFTFAANASSNPLIFNESGTEASFEIDTSYFQPGQGQLEFRAYGNDQMPQSKQIMLYPPPPMIRSVKAYRGDSRITIEGERLEQIRLLMANGLQAAPDMNNQNQMQNQASRLFIMQNPSDRILTNNIELKLLLEGGREFEYPDKFDVLRARPAIETNEQNEIEALPIDQNLNTNGFDLKDYPVVSIDTDRLSVAVKSTLADYSFARENITIETRIENGQVDPSQLPQASFEVLDSFNLRINFQILANQQQFLAGRRLQFRINDRQRGASNWYPIRQTFVRIPKIELINCKGEECKITGTGLDYIGQISTDGGNIWQPPLQVQPTPDGKAFMIINGVKNKNLLRIKLRDFINTDALPLK